MLVKVIIYKQEAIPVIVQSFPKKRMDQTSEIAFTPSANVLTAANKARGMLYFIKRSCTCLTYQIFQPLYRALMRPHLEYAIQGNRPYLKKDTYHLERIQQAATRCVKGLKDLSYEESLRELKLQSLEIEGYGMTWCRLIRSCSTKLILRHLNCSSSPEDQE